MERELQLNEHNPGEQKAYKLKDIHLRFLLYLPPRYGKKSKATWPVLCFLHGKREAAIDVIRHKTTNEIIDEVPQSIDVLMRNETPPWHCKENSPWILDFIVVSPQLPKTGYWEKDDLETVNTIISKICGVFSGDPKKIYLTGFSYGAKSIFDFVDMKMKFEREMIRPNALWPVDDVCSEIHKTCQVNRIWLHFGTAGPALQLETCRYLGLKNVDPSSNTCPETEGLYTQWNRDHPGTCRAAYGDKRVYEWLRDTPESKNHSN